MKITYPIQKGGQVFVAMCPDCKYIIYTCIYLYYMDGAVSTLARLSLRSSMNMFAYEGAIHVPIAVPFFLYAKFAVEGEVGSFQYQHY